MNWTGGGVGEGSEENKWGGYTAILRNDGIRNLLYFLGLMFFYCVANQIRFIYIYIHTRCPPVFNDIFFPPSPKIRLSGAREVLVRGMTRRQTYLNTQKLGGSGCNAARCNTSRGVSLRSAL